ncbi:MAG: alpha-2-macroglobulin family protein [Steroidobacteraceae bacterium]
MRIGLARVVTVLAAVLPLVASAANPPTANPRASGPRRSPAGRQAPRRQAPRVDSFSPQGYARHVRQVQVRFSASMVALGDPRLADPFLISCPATGKGRWADTRDWVYDFDADLHAGLRCRFMLKPGLKSLSGAPVSGLGQFSFDTGGPAIASSLPRDGWQELDENQVFLLRLDAHATQASIEANAYCAVDGLIERIPVRVLSGSERQAILAERRALGYDYFRLLWKNGAVTYARVRNREMERREGLIMVLQCTRSLPPGTRVLLHWGTGITTPSGLQTRTDQQLAFRVRPAFTAQLQCTRTNPRAGCMPVQPIDVSFTAPVPRALALAIRIKTVDGKLLVPTVPRNANAQVPTLEQVSFPAPLPASTTLTVVLPPGLLDDAGRTLENQSRFPLTVRVDAYPPLAKFSGTFGILEAREGGVLPVTLRNVEPVIAARQTSLGAKLLRIDADAKLIANWLTRVEQADRPRGEWVTATANDDTHGLKPHQVWHDETGNRSVFDSSDATTPFNIAMPGGGKPEEVIGIPLKRPGFYVVEIASHELGAALLGTGETRYVATAALVTDLAVHFEWGRESSLIWVTRLSNAKPVAGAEIAVSDFCDGSTVWQGRTGPDGTVRVEKSLGVPRMFAGCPSAAPLLVFAKYRDDFSFTESTWTRGIEPYSFGLPQGNEYTATIYHTVLDRSLFRAGETVSMKHFVRRHVTTGLIVPPGASGPHRITIAHLGSNERYQQSAVFDGNGVATSEWTIPAEAKLGDYMVLIDDRPSAQFKVAQFRLPSMRGSVVGPSRALVAPREVVLDLHVAYLSGGSAAGLPVKLRTLVEPQPERFADYPDYTFGGKPLQEGITTNDNRSSDLDFESDATQTESARTQTLPLVLDASGSARVTLAHLPRISDPSQLTAELEYADANGEVMTTTGTVRLVPASLSVGIRPESWIGSPGQLRFRVVALDLDGKPRANQPVVVSLYQSTAYSYRKRLIGGFYAYQTIRETKRLAPTCRGTTNAQGLLLCDVKPGTSGEILVRAETRDSQSAAAGATTSMWVIGEESWWFGGTSGDRMDVLPEKKEYETGDTARLQVRMPFRNATALVTIEREGILRHFVTTLHGKAPIVEVPIRPNDAPNVFVSVLAVRGRVRHAEPGAAKSRKDEVTALVDLTKPAYRLGIAEVKVGWKPHRLDVQVQPAQKVYKVREQVPVRIHVVPADGHALPPGSEIAVAAVDEALLDLSSNASWRLLEAMMGQRGLEVWTSTAQMQVVGKRHYGRKAVPQGGGGGREPDHARQLFDSLLYWKARVPLDAAGNATVTIPLNDSLSAFRIVAVAESGAELYGTGSATIRTTQDLILLSGLPPLVREGDHYAATFMVRNTSDHAISARVRAASPIIKDSLTTQSVELASGAARDLIWQVTAPVGASRIDWDVTAGALGGAARDHLKVSEQVIPANPVRTYQATIAQVTGPLSVPVERPLDAIAGRGGLEVTLQPSLAGTLDGVREYMGKYPYVCFEQLASRAIALDSRSDWDAVMARLPAYLDEDGLIKYFPTDVLRGDDSLTAYVLSIGEETGWPIPQYSRQRMLGALTGFVEGRIVRDSALPTADLTIRKLQAIEALSRYHAAQPGMLDSLQLDLTLLPTSSLLDWIGVLERTQGIPNAEQKLRKTFGLLRARLDFQGTTLGFSTERRDALWWLMISEDSNANRMLLAVLDRPQWKDDVPRLVRGALGRQHFGHWNTTVANAWGVLAMKEFSGRFETAPVTGRITLRYGTEHRSLPWQQAADAAATDRPSVAAQPPATVISLPWQPGRRPLVLQQTGKGAPWALVRAMAAIPLRQPLSSGFKITRTVAPIEQHEPGVWTRGDVARVHLDLEAQSDMSWVVVDDPVPAGATILGTGLGGQSELLTRHEQQTGWSWPAFEERRFDGFRAYYRFVPKGRWSLEYTVRFDNPGTFKLPPTRVEAMYAPEMLGEWPNAPVTVKPAAGSR